VSRVFCDVLQACVENGGLSCSVGLHMHHVQVVVYIALEDEGLLPVVNVAGLGGEADFGAATG
jgi:hypothetical protein